MGKPRDPNYQRDYYVRVARPQRYPNAKGTAKIIRKCKGKARTARALNLWGSYGLDDGQYEVLLAAQNGKCLICGNDPTRRPLFVDHDHRTGKVRGLLCYACNTGLGNFQDDLELLDRAMSYLQLYS